MLRIIMLLDALIIEISKINGKAYQRVDMYVETPFLDMLWEYVDDVSLRGCDDVYNKDNRVIGSRKWVCINTSFGIFKLMDRKYKTKTSDVRYGKDEIIEEAMLRYKEFDQNMHDFDKVIRLRRELMDNFAESLVINRHILKWRPNQEFEVSESFVELIGTLENQVNKIVGLCGCDFPNVHHRKKWVDINTKFGELRIYSLTKIGPAPVDEHETRQNANSD